MCMPPTKRWSVQRPLENRQPGVAEFTFALNEVLPFSSALAKMANTWETQCMTSGQATNLGNYLRRGREARGISARSLARTVGVEDTTVLRIERGKIISPRADLLGDIASALDLPIANVFLLAGYPISPELPSLDLYLAAKYPELSAADRRLIVETAERSQKTHHEVAS